MKTVASKHDDVLKDRIRWTFLEMVEIPSRYQKYLWDYPEGQAPLELSME